jgi:NAD(P)-dependent dehydrogenase (short-subunit alcohol dehydrogenase family)
VRAFARQGARVAFNGRNAEAAAHLIAASTQDAEAPLFVRCDVTDVQALQQSIATCAQRFGDVDVLVNNVADDQRQDFGAVDVAAFDASVAVNLRPHVFAIQAVLPGMRRRGGGSIVNVGSIGWMRKNGAIAVYATLKSAMVGLTKSLARDLGRDRIRINHLAPGWTMTEKQQRLWLDAAGERAIAEGQCLPDKVQPSDIAAMALFLAADDSRMITSQDFVVDGGWT